MQLISTRTGLVMVSLMTVLTVGCGSSNTASPVAPTAPVVPAASITTAGAGALVLHPSANPAFRFALETPLRIQETAGGSADWGYARMSLLRGGVEVERSEVGAGDINGAGYGRITANSNGTYTVLFRFNTSDFDDLTMTLGFTDRRDGRQFTTSVAGGSFTGVNIGLNALGLTPSHQPR